MKSYFFSASPVIHFSLIHINGPGGKERRRGDGGWDRMKCTVKGKAALSYKPTACLH